MPFYLIDKVSISIKYDGETIHLHQSLKTQHPESRPVKEQGLTISLRRDDTSRRFAALFQHSHVRRGQVRHPTVFQHLR
jgi:hypothetical protein